MTATVDTQEIARLRELHAAATAGEWSVKTTPMVIYGSTFDSPSVFSNHDGVTFVCDCGTGTGTAADAAYITAAHNAMPSLLTALEQARAERDAAKEDFARRLTESLARQRRRHEHNMAAAEKTTEDLLEKAREMIAAANAERDAALAELASTRAQLADAQQTIEWLHTVAEPEFDRRDSNFALLDMLGDMD